MEVTEITSQRMGEIISFYSYKGGTGRSMILANVAWILASSAKKIMVIDWDLEAPGLHRYFRPFLIDKHIEATDGLLDFIIRYADMAIKPEDSRPSDVKWATPYADISDFALSVNFPFPGDGKIDLVPAGRQSSTYAALVNSFNWQNFYERLGGGAFLEEVKVIMRKEYDYILIDSRTGVSDTAGICTVQMPDKLAIFFTYNNQSIEGAAAIAKSTIQERERLHKNNATKDFILFPVPTRVEQAELSKLGIRQRHTRSIFDNILVNMGLGGSVSAQRDYWSLIEVPYVPYYNYEEVLATFVDDPEDPKRILKPIVNLTNFLTNGEVSKFNYQIIGSKKQEILNLFAEISMPTPGTQEFKSDSFLSDHDLARQVDAENNINQRYAELRKKELLAESNNQSIEERKKRNFSFQSIVVSILISATGLASIIQSITSKNEFKQINNQNTHKIDSLKEVSDSLKFLLRELINVKPSYTALLDSLDRPKDIPKLNSSKKSIQKQEIHKTAFAYYGIYQDVGWLEKNFVNRKFDESIPKVGDTVIASNKVNMRKGIIEYFDKTGWENTPVVGIINQGDKLEVLEVHQIAGGAFIWIKFQVKN